MTVFLGWKIRVKDFLVPFIFENKIYYLSNCVNGREGNVENISDLRHSAIMLAHMHKAAEGFTLQKAIRYMEEFNASIEDGSKEADVSKFVRMEKNSKNY